LSVVGRDRLVVHPARDDADLAGREDELPLELRDPHVVVVEGRDGARLPRLCEGGEDGGEIDGIRYAPACRGRDRS
jgi:hypothetical protein